MFSTLRSKLSYANVVATLALFIALGGSSYAALTLPKNSVKARQIAKNAVGASEIKARAVGSSEVRNGSLLAGDFATGELPAGPQGPQGPQGLSGPAGSALAFAAVASSGDILEAESKNVADANVTKPGAGVYCFDNLGFEAKNVIATVRGQQNRWVYAILGGGLDCETDDDAVIKTGASGSLSSDGQFSVLFN